MNKVKINAFELFCLIVLFEFGTALIVNLGVDAKNNAWLSILLGLMGGLLLFTIYCKLYSQYPHLPLTSYMRHILGPYIGRMVGFFYIPYFMYIAARDLRDNTELITSVAYQTTPRIVISFIMISIVSYAVFKGFEGLARMGIILFFLILVTGVLGNLLVYSSGIINMKQLLPFLGDGWKSIFRTALQQVFFPFGETICFTMFLPFLDNRRTALKTGSFAMVFAGAILSYTISVDIAVLGVITVSKSPFPLLETVRMIEVGNFLEHLDFIGILTMMYGNFIKIALFFYAAMLAAADVFSIKKQNILAIPIGILILFLSEKIAESFPEHLEQGKWALFYIHPVFSFAIPLLLLILGFIYHPDNRPYEIATSFLD
jgi:spore germination protein KB